MVARKGKGKESKGATDFAAFMSQATSGAIVDLSNREEKFYKSGDFNLDRALDGGIPAGGVTAISGPAGSGKSLLSLTFARSVCEDGGRVAYFDTENKISKKAIRLMGLADMAGDDGMPLFSHFTIADNNLEEMINQIMEFAESGFFKMIVIDSVDSLVADEMEEKSVHDALRVGGEKARVWSAYLPQVISALERSAEGDDEVRCTLVFVRQVRSSMNPYGNSETSSGGLALNHYAGTALRVGSLKANDDVVDGKLVYQGATVRIQKTIQGAVPKDPVEIRYYIGDHGPWGVDPILSIVDEAIASRVIPPASATSHMYIACDELCDRLGEERGTVKFNGKKNLTAAIQDSADFREAVMQTIEEFADRDGDEFVVNEAEAVETEFEELD